MTGSGDAELMHFGTSVNIEGVGCGIGMDEENPEQVLLLIPLYIGGTNLIFIRVSFDPQEIAPQSFETHLDNRECVLFSYDFESRDFEEFASCVGGQLSFEEASMEEGAVVKGDFEIDLWGRRPFSL